MNCKYLTTRSKNYKRYFYCRHPNIKSKIDYLKCKICTLKEYKEQMKNIFSTCVSISTLDEAPMAYKNSEEIINAIEPTAEIIDHLKPLYNFKAEE